MRKMVLALAMSLAGIWPLAACGHGLAGEGDRELQAAETERGGDPSASSSFVEREFWLALAEEPRWHLDAARDLFLDGETSKASMELAKVAAILNFESRHSSSSHDKELLLASVRELREVAREVRYPDVPSEGLPSVAPMDHVAALALRSIAAHQVALARDAANSGDGRMAGALIRETAQAAETAFHRGGIDMGRALAAELSEARSVGLDMQLDGEGSRDKTLATLNDLDVAVLELGNVLTDRRR